MEDLQVLDEICSKKDLTKDNRKKAVTYLLKLSTDISNSKQVVEYLMKLHYTACPAYFSQAATELSDEQLVSIVEAFCASEQFKKEKPQNVLYPKGFGSVLSLSKAGKYELAFSILNYILFRSESGSQFAEGCKNNFKKAIIDANGLSSIQNLFEVVNADPFEAKIYEKHRFERFLDAVVDRTVTLTVVTSTVSSAEASQSRTLEKEEQAVTTYANKDEKNKRTAAQAPQSSLAKIETTQSEILRTLRKLTENRTAIDSLSSQVQKKDAEIAAAQVALREKEMQLSMASLELEQSKTALSSLEAQISDLTDRLRTSLKMDEISKNQELVTLKNDISEALKLDYSDFMGTKSSECSQDLFEAYRSTLTRIFKLLKRFKITCE